MVEGNKMIHEIPTSGFKIKEIFSTNPDLLKIRGEKVYPISESDLKKISFLQHPKDSVAVCELTENIDFSESPVQLVLDGIQDPGNMGTIIRLADWFGIENIVCSQDTVDVFNPKVIQASMGSFLRVKVSYVDLVSFLSSTKNVNIGTDMEGENIYQYSFPQGFNLILGNEGNGMRPETEQLIKESISIPRFGHQKVTESLNVSMATAIILGQVFSNRPK